MSSSAHTQTDTLVTRLIAKVKRSSGRANKAMAAPATHRRAIQVPLPLVRPSGRLVLRALEASDRGAFLAAATASRATIERFVDLWQPGESNASMFERQLELTRMGDATGRAWRRAAFLDGSFFVGCFSLSAIRFGLELEGEICTWVRSDLAGQGVGTEGVRMMVEHALSPMGLGLGRVVAHIDPENVACQTVAARIGMRRLAELTQLRLRGEFRPHQVWVRDSL